MSGLLSKATAVEEAAQPEPVEENTDVAVTAEAFSKMSPDEQANKNYEKYTKPHHLRK